MANDQSIELRVSLQERQMETLVEIVEEIRANYLTRAEFSHALTEHRIEFREALTEHRIEFRKALAQQHDDFKAALAEQRADFKAALDQQRADFTRVLNEQKVELKAYTDRELSHYSSKEDLAKTIQHSRNWVISVGISLAALQFTMQLVFFQWYTHLR